MILCSSNGSLRIERVAPIHLIKETNFPLLLHLRSVAISHLHTLLDEWLKQELDRILQIQKNQFE
jgi:hypothetical protein